MYRVIKMFTDKQDGNYKYEVGDVYPHLGLKVSADRLKELSTDKNRRKTPLIKLVEDSEPVSEKELEKSELEDSEPASKKKRKTKDAE